MSSEFFRIGEYSVVVVTPERPDEPASVYLEPPIPGIGQDQVLVGLGSVSFECTSPNWPARRDENGIQVLKTVLEVRKQPGSDRPTGEQVAGALASALRLSPNPDPAVSG